MRIDAIARSLLLLAGAFATAPAIARPFDGDYRGILTCYPPSDPPHARRLTAFVTAKIAGAQIRVYRDGQAGVEIMSGTLGADGSAALAGTADVGDGITWVSLFSIGVRQTLISGSGTITADQPLPCTILIGRSAR